MHEPTAIHDTQPWYRQGWPWLLISLPASAVIGGIITIILAVQSPNALVVDDYYKEGLAINQKKQRLATARSMAVQGLLRSDGTHLSLSLGSAAPITDTRLTLQIIHATRAELDQERTLQRTPDGRYAAELPMLSAGTWYLHLHPQDKNWEVRGRITTDGPFQAFLTAPR